MKNLRLILILAISIVALSCGNDDDGNEPTVAEPTLTAALLEGTYTLNFYEGTEVTITNVTGGTVTTTTNRVGDTFGNSRIIFDANGTFNIILQYRIEETITLENNDPVENEFIVTASVSGTYIVNDDEQTLTLNDVINDEDNADLTLLNSLNQVTLFNEDTLRIESQEMESSGDENTTFNLELRFSRL